MEDDSLRRGVISRLSQFSPIPPVSPTPNDLANVSTVDEMTVLQNYWQITQPTKHDVVRNWEDMQHLKEMHVDPMRHEVHQVMSKGLDFQDANVAMQTVLTIYTHSQTRVDAGNVATMESTMVRQHPIASPDKTMTSITSTGYNYSYRKP
ncbi:hypothetical protein EDB89DRAFT_2070097 [Lactarius sanguifluus]|nr:hypothetical protein EDB89DRAFT_2070097 [Lactarius sanguifluus]